MDRRGSAMYGALMPLIAKKNLFKSKWLRVHEGMSDSSSTPVIQMVVVSQTTKEPKAINLSAARAQEIADDLDAAARAIRAYGS